MSRTLEQTEIAAALKDLPLWVADGRTLRREFVFADFVGAFSFMTAGALVAEKLNHHPDWSNSYNRVAVSLTTHSAGGITELDLRLAASLSALAGDRAGK